MKTYTEHQIKEVQGFDVIDATSTGERPFKNLIWIGYKTAGAWLTADEAREVADAIVTIAAGIEQRQSHETKSH